MIVGQAVVVTQGTLSGQIGEIALVRSEKMARTKNVFLTIIDVRFEDGSTFGFYPEFLKQISPLEGLARMVDYEAR